MIQRRKSSSPMSLLVLLSVLAALGVAIPASAQCPWDGAPDCGTGAGPFSMCDRNFATGQSCQPPANNGNGTACNPSASAGGVYILSASQTSTAVQGSAFCSWNCGGEICRINLSDGLPVELMEFSIDGGEPDDGGDHSDETESDDGSSGR